MTTNTDALLPIEVERLWREVGLPEYFLGNGGTNDKLYKFVALCVTRTPQPSVTIEGMRTNEELEHLGTRYLSPKDAFGDGYEMGFNDVSSRLPCVTKDMLDDFEKAVTALANHNAYMNEYPTDNGDHHVHKNLREIVETKRQAILTQFHVSKKE